MINFFFDRCKDITPHIKDGDIVIACVDFDSGFQPYADVCKVCLASHLVNVVHIEHQAWLYDVEVSSHCDEKYTGHPSPVSIINSAISIHKKHDDRLAYLGFAKAFHIAKYAEALERKERLKKGFKIKLD